METLVGLTEALVEKIVTTTISETEQAWAIARQGLLDYLAAAWAGHLVPETCKVLDYVSGSGEAILIASNKGASLEHSALYNGFIGHYLDYDDVNESVRGHPSAVLYPALLAIASLIPVSGKRFLASYVIGVEVMARLAKVMGLKHYQNGFHNTATLGSMAGTAALGYLLGLDKKQMLNAMGIAAAQTSGLRLNFGTETKPLQAGMAAQKAVQSSLLAKAGVTASHNVLDSMQGIFGLYGEGVRKDTKDILLDKWGRSWELCKTGLWLKPWPFCSGAYHIADSARRLYQEEAFRPDEILQINLIFPPDGDAALIHHNPRTGEEGRFSAEFVAATGLAGLPYIMGNFSPKPVSGQIKHLMKKAKRYYDDRIVPDKDAQPEGRFGIVQIVMENGRIFSRRTDIPLGSPRNPLTSEEQYRKLADCCSEKMARKLARAVDELENCSDLVNLIKILKRKGD